MYELCLMCPEDRVEDVSDALDALDALSVSVEDADAQTDAEQALAIERAYGWLKRHGNPYLLSALDLDGRVGIDYGVYGVPETYVIDKAGVIRLKHTGPLTPESFSEKILPLMKELAK